MAAPEQQVQIIGRNELGGVKVIIDGVPQTLPPAAPALEGMALPPMPQEQKTAEPKQQAQVIGRNELGGVIVSRNGVRETLPPAAPALEGMALPPMPQEQKTAAAALEQQAREQKGYILGERFYVTNTGQYIPLPITREQYAEAAMKQKPYEEWQQESIELARQKYREAAASLKEGERLGQTEEEYIGSFAAKLSPSAYKDLIEAAYPAAIGEFLLETPEGQKFPRMAAEAAQKYAEREDYTQFFEKQIRAGALPAHLDIPSKILYITPAVGAIGGIFSEEFKEYGIKEQARVLGEAAVAGKYGEQLDFGISSIGETWTGTAGTTYLFAAAGGAAVGSAGKALLSISKPTAVLPTLVGGAKTVLITHSLAVKTAAAGTIVGFEAGKIAIATGHDIPGTTIKGYEVPYTAPEAAAMAAKDVVNLAAFYKGFQYGIEHGIPLKYETLKFGPPGEEQVVARGLFIEYGKYGEKAIRIASWEKAGVKLGAGEPFAEHVQTSGQAILAERVVAKGAFPAESARSMALTQISETRIGLELAAMSKEKGILYYRKPQEVEITSRHLTSEQNKVLRENVLAYHKKIAELYGSQARYQLGAKEFEPRAPADVDVLFRVGEKGAADIAEKMASNLRAGKLPSGEIVKGGAIPTARVSPTEPPLIEAKIGGEYSHLVDIKYIGSPLEAPPKVFGYPLHGTTITVGEAQPATVSALPQEASRKLAASISEFGKKGLQAAPHRMPKDPVGALSAYKGLEKAATERGYAALAERIGEFTQRQIQLWGQMGIDVAKGIPALQPRPAYIAPPSGSLSFAIPSPLAAISPGILPSAQISALPSPSIIISPLSPSAYPSPSSSISPSPSVSLSPSRSALPSPSAYPSPSSSVSLSPSYSPSISPSASPSYSPSISPSPSYSPSYSPSSPNISPSMAMLPYRPMQLPSAPQKAIKLHITQSRIIGAMRQPKGLPKLGIITAMVSRAVYGKATAPKLPPAKYAEYVGVPTVEMMRHGAALPELIMRGR